ncbi:MAG: efflux RND transporter periplasmic adaptor subunit [Vannielia sp.]|uniref:efflux RND transporter periplasmic adaptor subunit n=1 Tax=Rhodobacterales TaxID=204455 RepID=UPI002095CDC1|nr:efflux RND transporter periplasmic adaptor subunit [Oceanicola sp. 502str15]MCO6382419.1 efflux RND transporter periplasmic adaptor subunit [Oceanicola sp. 502str15]
MSAKPKEPPKPDWALTHREKKAAKARAEGGKPPRRKWPWIVLLLVAVAIGGGVARNKGLIGAAEPEATADAPQEAEAPATEAPAAEVTMQLLPRELSTVTASTLRETLRLTGSLAPDRQLGIPSEVSGRVDTVTKKAGDTVASGEVLVRIDIETLRNQVGQTRATAEATRAQLEFARTQLARTTSLVDRGVSTASNRDSDAANVRQLEANLAALEQQVANAEQSLEKATITAPFPGVIAERSVDPGAYVSPGTALLTLVDISNLVLEGAVPVLYAPRIATGQSVEITVDGFGDRSFAGTVERVAPVAASGTRILPIYATIENPEGVLKGGMFASGRLVLEEKPDAIGVPVEALREDDEGTFVLKRDGARVVRQPVTVARQWDRGRLAEISEGLAEGDSIVTAPLERLQPDMLINVIGE